MKLKSSFVSSFAFALVFSLSLVLGSIESAWAVSVGDVVSRDSGFSLSLNANSGYSYTGAPYCSPTSFTSVSVPSNDQQMLASYVFSTDAGGQYPVAGKFSAFPFGFTTSVFEPVDHDRYLFFTIAFENVETEFSTGAGSYMQWQDVNSTWHNTSISAGAREGWQISSYVSSRPGLNEPINKFAFIRAIIPAGARALKAAGYVNLRTDSVTIRPKLCVFGSFISDSESEAVNIEKMVGYLQDANLTLDAQNELLTLISTHTGDIYSILKDALKDETEALDSESSKAAETIMQQDNSEQYWSDKNTDNFNAIGLSDFSFDGGIVNGIQNAGSLFTRIWDSLGDAVIMYTFPLMLGIALVVIGRIARTSGSGKREDKDG